eukprot:SAG31_NODE_44888_length_261_cov_0.617284_1_plen_22_part_10
MSCRWFAGGILQGDTFSISAVF